MFFNNTLSEFANALFIGNRKRNARKSKQANCPAAEVLEDRMLLSAVYGDFNNDGRLDLATSDQYADVGNRTGPNAPGTSARANAISLGDINKIPVGEGKFQSRAGSVKITYGGVGFEVQELHENLPGVEGTAANNERFGAVLAVGDFNGDGFDDLAVGVPYQSVGGDGLAGSVHLFFGSIDGLSTANDRVIQQDANVSGAISERADYFGEVLTVGNFNGDQFDDLAVGIPSEDNLAGAVNIFHGSASGLQQGYVFTQDPLSGVNKEKYDAFGASLVSNDFNDDGFDDLAIGVPAETIETAWWKSDHHRAGIVNVIYGSSAGLTANGSQILQQGKDGMGAGPEDYDHFGRSLTSGDFNGDGVADLAIGVPLEDPFVGFGEVSNAGLVHVVYGSRDSGLVASSDQRLHHGTVNAGMPMKDDQFGETLYVGNFNGDQYDDLVIRVLGRDQNDSSAFGEVIVVYGSQAGFEPLPLTSSQQFFPPSLDTLVYGNDILVGDINDDGFVDLRISITGSYAGQSVNDRDIFYGTANGLTRNRPLVAPTQLVLAGDSDEFTPKLTWDDSSNASTYELLVYNKDTGQEVLNKTGIEFESFKIQDALNADANYQVFVRGSRGGSKSAWSSPLEFKTAGDDIGPKPSGDLVAKWAELSGAASYDLLAYDVTTGKEVANVTGIAATSFDLSKTLADIDEYSVYTKANFRNGTTGSWARVEVTAKTDDDDPVDETPSVPKLLGPAGDDIGLNPRITWTESANAVTYQMLIYNIDSGQQFLSKTGLEFESYTIPDSMSANTNYQVFVRGSKGSQKSAWSSPFEFKTDGSVPAPGTPVFLNASGVELSSQPTIAWNPAVNADEYEILLYNKNRGQLVEQAKGLSQTQFTPSEALDSNGEYQMFVRAVNANGQTSAWSTPLEFGIKESRSLTLDLVFANSQELFAI